MSAIWNWNACNSTLGQVDKIKLQFVVQHPHLHFTVLCSVWLGVPFIWFTAASVPAHPRFTAFWLQMCAPALARRSRWCKSWLPPMPIMNVRPLCIWTHASQAHWTLAVEFVDACISREELSLTFQGTCVEELSHFLFFQCWILYFFYLHFCCFLQGFDTQK